MDETTAELTRFAELRPSEPALTDDDLSALRAALFPDARPTSSAGPTVGEVVVLAPHREAVASPRRRPVAAAAAVIALAGGLGLWAAAGRDTAAPDEASPVGSGPTADPADVASPLDLPRVAFDEPGWTLSRAYEHPSGAGRAVLFASPDRFDGPWWDIAAADAGSDTGTLDRVEVDGIEVRFGEYERGVMASWTTPGGTPVDARGWGVGLDELERLVPVVEVVDGAVTLAEVPDGAELAAPDESAAVGRYGEYGFTHRDGRALQISFYPGGSSAQYSRTAGDERTDVRLGDEDASLLSYGGDRYRVNVQRGFWAWEFDGEPFRSQQEFLDTVAGVHAIDEGAWQAGLPAPIVGRDDVDREVMAALDGVPLPNGLDPADVTPAATLDRYQFVARLSGNVVCAWLDQWFDARDTGDTVMAQQAVDALATSREWSMLAEIADEGGWSGVVWMYADSIGGEGGVATDGGLEPPTRESAAVGLGCEW